jgi:hypothetical protein
MKFCTILLVIVAINLASGKGSKEKKVSSKEKKDVADTLSTSFSQCSSGQDVTAAKSQHKKKLEAIGIKTEKLDDYYKIMVQLSSACNDKEDNAKSGRISYFVNSFNRCTDDFIRSQPGMKYFDQDPKMKKDQKNSAFYSAYQKQKKHFYSCKKNAKKAKDCFTYEAADMCATLMTYTVQVSYRRTTTIS